MNEEEDLSNSRSFLTASQAIQPISRELSNVQEFLATIPSALGGSNESLHSDSSSLTQSQVMQARTLSDNLRVCFFNFF